MPRSAENQYYYQQLNKEQKQVYHKLAEGLTAMETSIYVPMVDPRELAEIYYLIRMDRPELFYSVTYRYRFYSEGSQIEVIPEYLYPKKQMKEHVTAMENRIRKLIRPLEGKSDREKEQFIHDFLCENIHYDKLKKSYSHEIIGPLGTGVGVCEGIAKSVKALCDAMGIWCIIALCDNNQEKGIRYRHMWNVIKLDGKYYHLDATWDNTLMNGGEIRYDYFNLADDQIFRDHEPVIRKIPACTDHDHFYYKEKKLSFTKEEDVRKRVAQAVKKGKVLTFHWRGGYLTREVLMHLIEIFEQEAELRMKHVRMSLNWPQAVMRVDFSEEKPDDAMVIEDAGRNERESEETEPAREK